MVCVTDQIHCARLIRAGEQLAIEHEAEMHVLSVQPRDQQRIHQDHKQGVALEFLFHTAREAGADMTVYYDNNTLPIICRFLRQHNASCVVMGGQPDSALCMKIKEVFPTIEILVIPNTTEATGS